MLGGTWKGNVFSGNLCRDVSFFVFKEMKNKRLGTIIRSDRNNEKVKRVVIAFVDDGYFCTSGEESE